MRSEKFNLEIVTSYFVRGAENKENSIPELRPPSFRGIMRYWFRAVAGGVIGDHNIQDLHRLESLIFGNTETGSPIQIRIPQQNLKIKSSFLLPHHNQAMRKGFDSNQTFNLLLIAPRPVNDEIWNSVRSILELSIALGGIGVRSRRGFGDLRITSSSKIVTANDWEAEITRLVQNAVSSIKKLAIINNIRTVQLTDGPSTFPCINKQGALVIGKNPFVTSQEAVTSFMLHVPDVNWMGYVSSHPSKRQGSPLWVKPVKIADSYYLQYVVLASDFPGSDYSELNSLLMKDCAKSLKIKGWNV